MNLKFINWVRSGMSASIVKQGNTSEALFDSRPGVSVKVKMNTGDGEIGETATVYLNGPGDVIGIDKKEIIRTSPYDGEFGADPTYFPIIEFDRPDLPWLMTPVAPVGSGKNGLIPWMCLVAVKDPEKGPDELIIKPAGLTKPLPSVILEKAMLPDLSQSWLWAHAQVLTAGAASTDMVRGLLEEEPELNLSRIISPVRLENNSKYAAFLVPVFEAGRNAGMGMETLKKGGFAWDVSASGRVELPFYASWQFTTGEKGDFRYLVEKLRVVADKNAGVCGLSLVKEARERFGIIGAAFADNDLLMINMEGALASPAVNFGVWPAGSDFLKKAFKDKLEQEIKPKPNLMTPPLYGSNYTGADALQYTKWFRELNLEPRYRAAAALGTRVIQKYQEEFMDSAWKQAAEIRAANAAIASAQLSLVSNRRIYRDRIGAFNSSSAGSMSDFSLLAAAAPLRAQIANGLVAKPDNSAATPAGVIRQQLPALNIDDLNNAQRGFEALAFSKLAKSVLSPAYRKMIMPGKRLSQKIPKKKAQGFGPLAAPGNSGPVYDNLIGKQLLPEPPPVPGVMYAPLNNQNAPGASVPNLIRGLTPKGSYSQFKLNFGISNNNRILGGGFGSNNINTGGIFSGPDNIPNFRSIVPEYPNGADTPIRHNEPVEIIHYPPQTMYYFYKEKYRVAKVFDDQTRMRADAQIDLRVGRHRNYSKAFVSTDAIAGANACCNTVFVCASEDSVGYLSLSISTTSLKYVQLRSNSPYYGDTLQGGGAFVRKLPDTIYRDKDGSPVYDRFRFVIDYAVLGEDSHYYPHNITDPVFYEKVKKNLRYANMGFGTEYLSAKATLYPITVPITVNRSYEFRYSVTPGYNKDIPAIHRSSLDWRLVGGKPMDFGDNISDIQVYVTKHESQSNLIVTWRVSTGRESFNDALPGEDGYYWYDDSCRYMIVGYGVDEDGGVREWSRITPVKCGGGRGEPYSMTATGNRVFILRKNEMFMYRIDIDVNKPAFIGQYNISERWNQIPAGFVAGAIATLDIGNNNGVDLLFATMSRISGESVYFGFNIGYNIDYMGIPANWSGRHPMISNKTGDLLTVEMGYYETLNRMFLQIEPYKNNKTYASQFKEAARDVLSRVHAAAALVGSGGSPSVSITGAGSTGKQPQSTAPAGIPSITMGEAMAAASAIRCAINPDRTVPARLRNRLSLPKNAGYRVEDDFTQLIIAPKFEYPMSELLIELREESFFIGASKVENDTVSMLVTNNKFIEAFMVGLNHEMGREFLWRDFPADYRATYFDVFWNKGAGGVFSPDILPIADWPGNKELGVDPATRAVGLLLMIKAELLRRIPNAMFFAAPAIAGNGKLEFDPDESSRQYPMFSGELSGGTVYFAFKLTRAEALDKNGWFFVFQENPTAPRFGFNEPLPHMEGKSAKDVETWSLLDWKMVDMKNGYADLLNDKVNTSGLKDMKKKDMEGINGTVRTWGSSPSETAYITLRRPVRVAIHASKFLTDPK